MGGIHPVDHFVLSCSRALFLALMSDPPTRLLELLAGSHSGSRFDLIQLGVSST